MRQQRIQDQIQVRNFGLRLAENYFRVHRSCRNLLHLVLLQEDLHIPSRLYQRLPIPQLNMVLLNTCCQFKTPSATQPEVNLLDQQHQEGSLGSATTQQRSANLL